MGRYSRNGGRDVEIRAVLDPLPISLVPFDHELAYQAGVLLPATRAADRAWQAIAAQARVRVELIR